MPINNPANISVIRQTRLILSDRQGSGLYLAGLYVSIDILGIWPLRAQAAAILIMTFQQELESWKSPTPIETASVPALLNFAPPCAKLKMPPTDKKPTIITFLRHCGCPFAEKSFKEFRKLSNQYPEVSFVAVSHSSQEHTDKWIIQTGGQWEVKVVIDTEREVYAAWGLGVSTAWHVLSPWSMYSVLSLARNEKITNRPTETGNRWQTAGSFAVDGDGTIKWSKPAKSASDIADYREGLTAIGVDVDV